MKQFRVLRIFVLAAAAVAWGIAPTPAQANPSAPHAVAGVISFHYFMNDGSRGSGSYYLSDNATFVDNNGDTGIWNFNQANNRYSLYYNAGAHCGALSIGAYNPADNQIRGLRFCTDGSGGRAPLAGRGVWFGVLFQATTARVSIASDGAQGNGPSYDPAVSADGGYVAFSSFAANLVGGDTNFSYDVFVHDRQTGETSRVSVASDGTQGNGLSGYAAISAGGRYVAFQSDASNLVANDTNAYSDIFVHDRQTGQTSRVSVASDGAQGNGGSVNPAVSADAQFVAFASYANNLVSGDNNSRRDVFVHNRQTGQTSRVSLAAGGAEGNGDAHDPVISGDGRYVAFSSEASNLVSGDTNGFEDVFVHDRQTGQTSRVSVAATGSQGNGRSWYPAIAADGQYVAFVSAAGNLVSDDTNGAYDIFVHEPQTGQTSRVSVASDGSQAEGWSEYAALSASGRYVTFASSAANLVSDDTNGQGDIFRHDRQTGQTSRVSLAADGAQGNGESRYQAVSASGRYVVFDSWASNLVGGDTNGQRDIFIRDQGP